MPAKNNLDVLIRQPSREAQNETKLIAINEMKIFSSRRLASSGERQ